MPAREQLGTCAQGQLLGHLSQAGDRLCARVEEQRGVTQHQCFFVDGERRAQARVGADGLGREQVPEIGIEVMQTLREVVDGVFAHHRVVVEQVEPGRRTADEHTRGGRRPAVAPVRPPGGHVDHAHQGAFAKDPGGEALGLHHHAPLDHEEELLRQLALAKQYRSLGQLPRREQARQTRRTFATHRGHQRAHEQLSLEAQVVRLVVHVTSRFM